MLDTGIKPVTSVVGGRRLDDWATELLYNYIGLKCSRKPSFFLHVTYVHEILLQD